MMPVITPLSTCKIDNCSKPIRGRGWCIMHWQRWRSNGDPLVVKNVVSAPIFLPDGTPAHKSKIYSIWRAMRARCENPADSQYSSYGGRSIKVCDRWSLFSNFLEDMGERPEGKTLDRVDNDKGYSPDNCRWATLNQQNQNRRVRSKSGYLGVTFRDNSRRWIAALTHEYKSVYLGSFDDPLDAALAYDCAVVQIYGSTAKTNILGVAS